MTGIRFVCWEDEGAWLGYLREIAAENGVGASAVRPLLQADNRTGGSAGKGHPQHERRSWSECPESA